jgi:ABC-2 type transport system permease protein
MKVFLNGFWAVAAKEALHIVRDRLTLALLITVPIVQLLLFGFAIDLHPKNLPTALVAHENDKFVDRAVEELEAVGYFKIVKRTDDLTLAERWLATSRAQFILELPENLGFQAVTGQQPSINLIVDASDPVASIIATQAAQTRYAEAAASQPLRIRLNIERRYNPGGASRLFIVPGLLGVVLTLTLVLLGAFSLVRERERGSFETMILLPVPRAAILLGKTAPYFLLGCVLFVLLLICCSVLLGLPWHGISPALATAVVLFVAANLALGIALSLLARNQMQAMQLGVFFYLPSMLLSGFMFPFHGMPAWAQGIGTLLPLTHFLRVVRGILLKNLPDGAVWGLLWPIALFALLASLLAVTLFRRGTKQ